MKLIKNKKAFTLVETLGVIIILAIVLGIVSVSFIYVNNSMKKSYYKGVEASLFTAGGEYFTYNKGEQAKMFGDISKVSVKNLVEGKYISNVVGRGSNTCNLESSYVGAYKDSYDKTNYYVCLICDDYESDTCNPEVGYNLQIRANVKDTSQIYKENTWAPDYITLTFDTLNDIQKVYVKKDGALVTDCELIEKNGYKTCKVTINQTGSYKVYGEAENGNKTEEETFEIKVDSTPPSFEVRNQKNELITGNEISYDKEGTLTISGIVKEIKDSESGIKKIRYSFEKEDESFKYKEISSNALEFEFKKENVELGKYKLIVEVTDNVGNVKKREIIYKVYSKVEKPDSGYCKANLIYNGISQILTKAPGVGFYFENNYGIDANTYDVVVKLEENYAWIDGTTNDAKIQCTIDRIKDSEEGVCNNLIYNGQVQELVKDFSGVNVTYIENSSEGKDAGVYTVIAQTDSNHAFLDGETKKTFNCSIAKNVVTVTPKDNQSKIYGTEEDPTLTYNVATNVSGETPEFTGKLAREEGEDVGSYKITQGNLALKNNGTFKITNYDLAFASGKVFKITKADAICPTTKNYTGTYDGENHTITSSGESGGTVQYRKIIGQTIGEWGTTNPVRLSAGTTTVEVRVVGDSNHNSVDCTSRTITLSKKPLTITAKDQTIDYGTAITNSTNQVTVATLLSGHTLDSITLTQSTTNATTNGEIIPSEAVIKSGTTDVTSNYQITYTNGKLVINETNICATFYINGASKIGNSTTDLELCCQPSSGSTSCSITTPTITPITGFTALGWTDDGDKLETWDSSSGVAGQYAVNTSVVLEKQLEQSGTEEIDEVKRSFYAITRSNTRNSFNVTYDLNGATSYTTGGETYPETKTFSCYAGYAYNGGVLPDSCVVTLPTITKSGWTVHGWDEDSENQGTPAYTENQIYTLYDDITLYAITSKNITLTYNTNSTTSVTTDNLTTKSETKTIYNGEGTMFNIPEYDNAKVCRSNGGDTYHGYKILGLNGDTSSNTVDFCFGDQIYLENDKTLYAVWQDMYATAVGNVSNNLRLRSGPGTSYSQIASIEKGDPVYITSSNYTWNSTDKHTWYPVIFGSLVGYAAGNTSNNSTLSNLTLKTKPNSDSCSYTYSCTSNNKLLSITPSDVTLNITSTTSKRKMSQTLTINNQCGPMSSATSSDTSLVTATTAGVITAKEGSVAVNELKTATVTYTTKYGCSETVNVTVKNTDATAPEVSISLSGNSSTCSGAYLKGATATVKCVSDLPITSYSAKLGSTEQSATTSGNTKTSTISLSSTGTKTISVTCANSEGLTSRSKSVKIRVYSASSSCTCKTYYSANSSCTGCSSWTVLSSSSSGGYYASKPKAFCSNASAGMIMHTYSNCFVKDDGTYNCGHTTSKCTAYKCKEYKSCCHT